MDKLDQLLRDARLRQAAGLQERQSNLLDEEREEAPNVSLRYDPAGWFEDAWEAAGEDVEEQRAVLDDAIERIWVRRGGTGRQTEAKVLARLTYDWKVPEDLGPVETDEELSVGHGRIVLGCAVDYFRRPPLPKVTRWRTRLVQQRVLLHQPAVDVDHLCDVLADDLSKVNAVRLILDELADVALESRPE